MEFAGGVGGMGGNQNAHVDVVSWYLDIPTVSRLYLTGAFLTTAACGLDIVSPFSLYFNWDLVFSKGEVWRLVTSYLFFGAFSVDFLFHMYFLVSRQLFSLLRFNKSGNANDFFHLAVRYGTAACWRRAISAVELQTMS